MIADLTVDDELIALETGAVDPANFPHSEHVRLGYEMLGRYRFGEAVTRFSRGLRLMATKNGKPQAYHETITIAFLALISERRAVSEGTDWDQFKMENADLMDKRCLERWYEPEQLKSDLARKTFCLPQPKRECLAQSPQRA
jgi:hypothetical protein